MTHEQQRAALQRVTERQHTLFDVALATSQRLLAAEDAWDERPSPETARRLCRAQAIHDAVMKDHAHAVAVEIELAVPLRKRTC